MLQRILESKLLWRIALMIRRRHFPETSQSYIRLIGKKDKDGYKPYLRLSYDSNDGWYYRENGMVGKVNYQDAISMSKLFIKHAKLRSIRFI